MHGYVHLAGRRCEDDANQRDEGKCSEGADSLSAGALDGTGGTRTTRSGEHLMCICAYVHMCVCICIFALDGTGGTARG